MPSIAGPIVGTITIEPLAESGHARWQMDTDDSSLAALLASFANCSSLTEGGGSTLTVDHLITSTRWSRPAAALEEAQAIKADVARLMAELDTEYDALRHQL